MPKTSRLEKKPFASVVSCIACISTLKVAFLLTVENIV